MFVKKNLAATGRLLLEFLEEMANATLEASGAFLASAGSAKILARNIYMSDRSYYSAMQNMKKRGYIKKINEDQFLITPKAITKARILKVEMADWEDKKWDGRWRIIAFDIPNTKNRERGIFRSLIKRKGFVGLQKSVFIAPYADFNELAQIRSDLKIEKYVSFLIAECSETDDDKFLRKRFNLD